MPKPQQSELRRSGNVPALDPDATEAAVAAQDVPTETEPTAPVPPEQQPGHEPADEQDKPEQEVAAALGVVDDDHEPDSAPNVTGMADQVRRRPIGTTIGLAVAGAGVVFVLARSVLRRGR